MKKSFPIFWDWESGENLRPLFLGVGGNRNSRSPLNYVDGNGVGNVPQTSQRHSSWNRWKPPGEISNPHGLHERLKVVTLSQLELATHLEGYSCPRSYVHFYQQHHGWVGLWACSVSNRMAHFLLHYLVSHCAGRSRLLKLVWKYN